GSAPRRLGWEEGSSQCRRAYQLSPDIERCDGERWFTGAVRNRRDTRLVVTVAVPFSHRPSHVARRMGQLDAIGDSVLRHRVWPGVAGAAWLAGLSNARALARLADRPAPRPMVDGPPANLFHVKQPARCPAACAFHVEHTNPARAQLSATREVVSRETTR